MPIIVVDDAKQEKMVKKDDWDNKAEGRIHTQSEKNNNSNNSNKDRNSEREQNLKSAKGRKNYKKIKANQEEKSMRRERKKESLCFPCNLKHLPCLLSLSLYNPWFILPYS